MVLDPGTATLAAAAISAGAGLGSAALAPGAGSNRNTRHLLQRQLQWKVQDAKAAGIHPLYAVGAPAMGGIVTHGSGSAIY